MPAKRTFGQFIKEATEKHKGKYDYSKIENIPLDQPIGTKAKFLIICPYHGEFYKSLGHHLNGQGCPCCSLENQKLTTEIFKEKSNILHNNRYDYSLVNYVDYRSKVSILCPTHGKFSQTPSNHLSGAGCILCNYELRSLNARKNFNDFISDCRKVHGNFYSYEEVEYINCYTKIIIGCPLHGNFEQKPASHLSGKGCMKCAGAKISNKNTMSLEDFIDKSNLVHNFIYDYSLTQYKNTKTLVEIICKEHGLFEITPHYHITGGGCPDCCSNTSKGETLISFFLNEKNIKYEPQKTFNNCKNPLTSYPLRFDFYLPLLNVIIEYDGKQHFSPVECWGGEEALKGIQIRDEIKNQYCLDNNINLLRIKFDQDIKEELINFGVLDSII